MTMDWVAVHQPLDQARATSLRIQADLEKAGFLENSEKSDFKPKQTAEQLGFVLSMCTNST